MAQLVDRELAADGVESNGYAMLSLIGVRGSARLTELADDLGLPLTTASDSVVATVKLAGAPYLGDPSTLDGMLGAAGPPELDRRPRPGDQRRHADGEDGCRAVRGHRDQRGGLGPELEGGSGLSRLHAG
jgi:hypothetical protein